MRAGTVTILRESYHASPSDILLCCAHCMYELLRISTSCMAFCINRNSHHIQILAEVQTLHGRNQIVDKDCRHGGDTRLLENELPPILLDAAFYTVGLLTVTVPACTLLRFHTRSPRVLSHPCTATILFSSSRELHPKRTPPLHVAPLTTAFSHSRPALKALTV